MNIKPMLLVLALFALMSLSACGQKTSFSQAPAIIPQVSCAEKPTCKVTLGWSYIDAERAEITGFKLYYGTVSRTDSAFAHYDHTVEIGPNEKEITIPNLGGTAPLYFTMTAYATTVTARCSTGSCESPYSNEVSIDFTLIPVGSALKIEMGG